MANQIIQPDEKGMVNVSWEAKDSILCEYSLNTNTGEAVLREYQGIYNPDTQQLEKPTMDHEEYTRGYHGLLTETTCTVKDKEVTIGEDGHVNIPLNKEDYICREFSHYYRDYSDPDSPDYHDNSDKPVINEHTYVGGEKVSQAEIDKERNQDTICRFDEKGRLDTMEMHHDDTECHSKVYYDEKGGLDHTVDEYKNYSDEADRMVLTAQYGGVEPRGEDANKDFYMGYVSQGQRIMDFTPPYMSPDSVHCTIEFRDGQREEREEIPATNDEKALSFYGNGPDSFDRADSNLSELVIKDIHRDIYGQDGNKIFEYDRTYSFGNEAEGRSPMVEVSQKWFDKDGSEKYSLEYTSTKEYSYDKNDPDRLTMEEKGHLVIKDKDEVVVDRTEPHDSRFTFAFYDREHIEINVENPVRDEIERAREQERNISESNREFSYEKDINEPDDRNMEDKDINEPERDYDDPDKDINEPDHEEPEHDMPGGRF